MANLPYTQDEIGGLLKERSRQGQSQPFDYRRINERGPMVLYQHCSFTNRAYTEGIELPQGKTGYDQINWNK